MPETIRAAAMKRLRAAFTLNNIPWSDEWRKAPTWKLLDVAKCWEKRAAEAFEEARDALLCPLPPLVSTMAGFPQTQSSTGGRTKRQTKKRGKPQPSYVMSPCGDGGMIS